MLSVPWENYLEPSQFNGKEDDLRPFLPASIRNILVRGVHRPRFQKTLPFFKNVYLRLSNSIFLLQTYHIRKSALPEKDLKAYGPLGHRSLKLSQHLRRQKRSVYMSTSTNDIQASVERVAMELSISVFNYLGVTRPFL